MQTIGHLSVERRDPEPSSRPRSYPLLFVHGMWCGSWVWSRYLALAASHGWRAWALNLRGHGGREGEGPSFAAYVEDLYTVLRAVGPAVLIGHSLGGLVAQAAAALPDAEVEAVVLVTSAPPAGIFPLSGAALPRLWRYLPELFAGRSFEIREADARALLLNRLGRVEQGIVLRKFVPASGRAARDILLGVRVRARRIRCPMLVVSGRHDRLTPPWMQRRITAKYGADYREFPDHGHMLMVEEMTAGDGDRPAREILTWLESHVQ